MCLLNDIDTLGTFKNSKTLTQPSYNFLLLIFSYYLRVKYVSAVRYGRVPKRSREQSTEEATHLMISNADQNENDGKQLEIYDLILTISQAHHANCAYTEENTRNLVQKPLMQAPPSRSKDNEASSTAESAEDERCWLWTQFASSITPNVQRIVEFAKRVPGFCDLSQDDQLILIKIGFFEIWLSHIARLTTSTCMVFDDGTVVTKQQLETMYDVSVSMNLYPILFRSTLSFHFRRITQTL